MGIKLQFKQYCHRYPLKAKHPNVYIYVILLFGFMLLLTSVQRMAIQSYPAQFGEEVHGSAKNIEEVSMLLNSGLVQAQKAELQIIIWFEDGKPLLSSLNLPHEGWHWEENLSHTRAYTLAGSTIIHKNSEAEIFAWYLELSQKVQNLGGQAYWDERVPESIDLVRHAEKINIKPFQYSLSRNGMSITGWQELIPNTVQAGEDLVNIQFLTRGNGKKGKTAIAIPVLLVEF